MKRTRRLAIAIAALMLTALLPTVAASCGSSTATSSPSPSPSASQSADTVNLEAVSEAQTLDVDVGDVVDVKLPGNPSTGYSWVFVPDGDGVLAAAGEQSFSASSDMEGAGGVVTIPIKAAKAGSAIALFKEMPPGSGQKTPAHVWGITVAAVDEGRPAEVSLNQTYVADSATLNAGDTLKVYFESQSGSTGYVWRLGSVNGNAVQPAGQQVVSGDQPGAPAQTVFSFSAAGPGQSTIVFNLRAPNGSITGTYAMTAQVKPVSQPVPVAVDWMTARRGQMTNVMQGDTLTVSLDARPSDDYGWSMTAQPAGALKQLGEPVFHPNGSQIGAGGRLDYTYRVAGSGPISLEAEYHNLSEAGEPPTRDYIFRFKSAAHPQPAVVSVTGAQATPTVRMDRDDKLRVTLEGNAGTALSWSVASLDTSVLRMVGKPLFKPDGDQPGAAGTVTFTFKAVKPGTTTAILANGAPGELPAQTLAFRATVGQGRHSLDFLAAPPQVAEPVTLESGQTLRVALDGNPTTGFTWVDATPDNAVLAQAGEPTFKPASDLTGANGSFYLSWKAIGPGGEFVLASYDKDGGSDSSAMWATWVTVRD